MAGSTQSKQWWIESLYRYKAANSHRIIVLNIGKLYKYVYSTLNISAIVYFE